METNNPMFKYLHRVKKSNIESNILPSEYNRIIQKYVIKKNKDRIVYKDRRGNIEIKNK